MAVTEEVLGEFHGSDEFPIEWQEGEKDLFWIYDDLHIPNPVSPMFFDIGGWWLTCDHMFRRFGTPFACDWIAKEINGYVYTAAVPADSEIHSEATEYQARYVPRVPRDPEHPAKIGAYLGWVLPEYAGNFLAWWRDRLRPEIERNFAYLDGIDYGAATMREMAVYLEDAIDVHDRHWKIHWMLNFAQFSSTTNLNAVIGEVRGGEDPGLMGRPAVEPRGPQLGLDRGPLEDQGRDQGRRRAEQGVRGRDRRRRDARARGLRARPAADRRARSCPTRRRSATRRSGRTSSRSGRGARTRRRSSRRSAATSRPTTTTRPTSQAVRDDLEAAKREVMEGVEGDGRARCRTALDLSLGMNPLTPDHHFYIDQGTNARLRIALIAIGAKLADAGALDDAEDVMYLRYNELRLLMADPSAFDAHELVSDRRDDHEEAAEKRPPSWVGTATQTALDFPYNALWGFPEKFHAGEPSTTGEVKGLAASPGVVEGPARYVTSLEEFDQVQSGEILVCRMTNPAWVVLFTKIIGLVTEAGGAVSHPAVVAREFGIPAVVGTTNAGERIKTGDRIRVNGTTGVVEILE